MLGGTLAVTKQPSRGSLGILSPPCPLKLAPVEASAAALLRQPAGSGGLGPEEHAGRAVAGAKSPGNERAASHLRQLRGSCQPAEETVSGAVARYPAGQTRMDQFGPHSVPRDLSGQGPDADMGVRPTIARLCDDY